MIGYQPFVLPGRSGSEDVDEDHDATVTVVKDPMDFVFPKVAKCRFDYFALSGASQNIDTICTLPVNILNEKIFVAVWYIEIILYPCFTCLLPRRTLDFLLFLP